MLRCISFFSFIKRILILCILLYRENGHQPPVGGGPRWEAAKHLELQGCCAGGRCGTWGLLALVCKHTQPAPSPGKAGLLLPILLPLLCAAAKHIPSLSCTLLLLLMGQEQWVQIEMGYQSSYLGRGGRNDSRWRNAPAAALSK